jgi:hypothetical protein
MWHVHLTFETAEGAARLALQDGVAYLYGDIRRSEEFVASL